MAHLKINPMYLAVLSELLRSIWSRKLCAYGDEQQQTTSQVAVALCSGTVQWQCVVALCSGTV